jgi:hypothetical protein
MDMRDLDPPRNKYIIHALSFKEAAILAAEKDLWLHSWSYLYDVTAITAYMVEK